MRRLVLDASVWLAANDVDDAHVAPAADLIRRAASGELSAIALDLTLYEVANAAIRRWRSPEDAEVIVELVDEVAALERVDAQLASAAFDAAERHGLTVYDAAYVACAARRDATLVSTDVRDLVGRGLAVEPGAV